MDIGASVKITAGVVGQAQLDKLNETLARTEKAQKSVGVSAAQTAAAMRTLPAQFTDIATQLAGGQSPFLILLQQGGQIKDSFGGIRPAASALLSLLSPMRLVVGGIAAGFGTLALAAYQGAEEISNLNRSLALTGNFAGQTQSSYEALKKTIAETTGLTVGEAKELISASIASAAFGPSVIKPAITAMARIQKLSGQTSEGVVKDFASMRNGVAAWAAEHNRQYNYLTAAQYKYIKQLEDHGDKEAAMAANIEALNKAFADRTVQLGYLQHAWRAVKVAASSAWDAMLGLGRPDTPEERIATLQKGIEANKKMLEQLDSANSGAGFFKTDNSQAKAMAAERIRQALVEIESLKAKGEAAKQAAADQAKADAEEQARIEKEKQRPAIDAANAALRLQQAKNASQQRINLYDQEEAKIGRVRDLGFLSETEYAERSAQVKQDKLRVSISLAQQEMAIERGKEAVGEAAEAQKAARIAAIQGRIGELQSQVKVVGIEAKGTVAKSLAAAGKSFDDFQKRTREQIKELVLENDAEAAKLIGDPIKRKAAALDAEIAKIKAKYDKLIIDVQLRLQTSGGDEAGQLKKDIEDLQRERERAVELKREGSTDPSSYFGGMKAGLKQIREEVENVAESTQQLMVSAFDKASDALTDFVMTGKLNFNDFAKSVIADISKMIVKQLMFNALKSALGGTGIGAALGFAKGGAFDGGVQAFASGGIVDSPTPFRFASGGAVKPGVMGEAGPEAIMPLKRGRDGKLGVVASGGQHGGGVSIGSIVVQNNGEASASDTSGRNGAEMGKAIATAVQAEIIKQRRPGGLLYAA